MEYLRNLTMPKLVLQTPLPAAAFASRSPGLSIALIRRCFAIRALAPAGEKKCATMPSAVGADRLSCRHAPEAFQQILYVSYRRGFADSAPRVWYRALARGRQQTAAQDR